MTPPSDSPSTMLVESVLGKLTTKPLLKDLKASLRALRKAVEESGADGVAVDLIRGIARDRLAALGIRSALGLIKNALHGLPRRRKRDGIPPRARTSGPALPTPDGQAAGAPPPSASCPKCGCTAFYAFGPRFAAQEWMCGECSPPRHPEKVRWAADGKEGLRPDLLPHHAKALRDAGIPEDVIRERGYFSATRRSDLRRLGFAEAQCGVPALVIPLRSPTGEAAGHQIRPDFPRVDRKTGKTVKYESRKGAPARLDVPSRALPWLRDPERPLLVTEGAKKADTAAARELAVINLAGVWSFGRGVEILADWESVPLKGRRVVIAFDSDVIVKPAVRAALDRLREFLLTRGAAEVKVAALPPGPQGEKTGLDDFFARGATAGDFWGTVRDLEDLPALPPEREGPRGDLLCSIGPYRIRSSGIFFLRNVGEAEIEIQLTNFVPRIVAERLLDDGSGEPAIAFDVEASVAGRVERLVLTPAKFADGTWPLEKLGASAMVYPSPVVDLHVRAATQAFSREAAGGAIPRRVVFAHLGWRGVGRRHVFVHGSGAIGPEGPVDGVEVELPPALRRYVLPLPPGADALRTAIRETVGVLLDGGLAPDRIMIPLLAAAFRAPLGGVDLSLFLAGPTGVFKSELASLAARFYGAGMDRLHLPAGFSSTGNSIEALAFVAKDVLLVVDDFAPGGSISDVQRQHREADRVFRAQGNAAGRQRLRSDATLRPEKPPRGMILATGEDVPRGQSLRARLFAVEVAPGEVGKTALTLAQKASDVGVFAAVMAGYIRWLAGRYEAARTDLPKRIAALRADALSAAGGHPRAPEAVASLAVGIEEFLAFAGDGGAITVKEANALRIRAWSALDEAARRQAVHLVEAEPCTHFLRLLADAIASGRAHLAGPDGEVPRDVPEAWGWRVVTSGEGENEQRHYRPGGNRVGYVDGPDMWLLPDASFAAAQDLARIQGEAIVVSAATLRRRLHERGYLASIDRGREVLAVRQTLEGARRSVLHLRAHDLAGGASPHVENPTNPSNRDGSGPPPPVDGRVPGRIAPGKGQNPTANPTAGPTETEPSVAEKAQMVGLVESLAGRGEPAGRGRAQAFPRPPGEHLPGPVPSVPNGWDRQMADLVEWFQGWKKRRAESVESFELAPGRRVSDPVTFLKSLEAEIATGPGGPRAKTGALQADLRRLRELFGAVSGSDGDSGDDGDAWHLRAREPVLANLEREAGEEG